MGLIEKRLRQRAQLTETIRRFFKERDVLEVSTPLLSQAAVTDVNIESFEVAIGDGRSRYLRTSPEFPLKRLLGAGAPDVFEMGPVFREGECGRLHNPEFTLLEWYRLGFSMAQLIDEVVALLQVVSEQGSTRPVTRIRYYDLFKRVLNCDVQGLSAAQLAALAAHHIPVPKSEMDVDQWLDFLFGAVIQPSLGNDIVVVTHFPASQAALARLDEKSPGTALRFEVFMSGIELANGFEELTDSHEQAARFDADNALRRQRGQRERPVDTRFLAALDDLPPCSGVALGLDRLLMIVFGLSSIDEALSMSWAQS